MVTTFLRTMLHTEGKWWYNVNETDKFRTESIWRPATVARFSKDKEVLSVDATEREIFMAGHQLHLSLSNIGPHIDTKLDASANQARIGIFAMNGQGKSFISRTFAIASNDSMLIPETSNSLLSLGSKKGKMEFSFTASGESAHELSIGLTRDIPPARYNLPAFKFLVFNSDFVRENLERKSFSPSDDYTGYVVGKESIDISKDEETVEALWKKGTALKKAIEDKIVHIKAELSKMGVRPNTLEFGQITYERVTQEQLFDENASSHEILQQISKLKSLPEDSPDISLPEMGINFFFLNDVVEILNTSYEKDSFTDAFLEEMHSKHAFIESGLSTINDVHSATQCPFCKQTLSSDAKALFWEYSKYLEGAEAQVLKQIDLRIGDCQSLKGTINKHIAILLQAQSDFDKLKVYFPSLAETQLIAPHSTDEFDTIFDQLIAKLHTKKKDITRPMMDIQAIIDNLNALNTRYSDSVKASATEFEKINSLKRHVNDEQLVLRRRLCKAKANELINDQKNNIHAIQQTRDEFQNANSALSEKRSKMQTSKSELISTTFSTLVSHFFANKYTVELNASTFSVVFKEQALGNIAPHVLSDGEKSIMAFCYFLASVHKYVDDEDDYSKLFFIIDDPISSMDFNYVYAMAQVIRSIKTVFPKIEKEQYIIMTHSAEFMGILFRNKILSKAYVLHNGKFTQLKGELLLPYEAHLRDIYNVASDATKATHTTANSIRHILETLWRFERPDLSSLKDYFETLDEIKDKSFLLYSLTNDLSHGVLRSEFPTDEKTIQQGCFALIEYMKTHYPGQIKHLEVSEN